MGLHFIGRHIVGKEADDGTFGVDGRVAGEALFQGAVNERTRVVRMYKVSRRFRQRPLCDAEGGDIQLVS